MPPLTKQEKYMSRQRERLVAARERAERDRTRTELRKALFPPAPQVDEGRIEARMAERRWGPLTPEVEDEANRMNAEFVVNGAIARQGAVARGAMKAMAKAKVQAERALLTEEQRKKFTVPGQEKKADEAAAS